MNFFKDNFRKSQFVHFKVPLALIAKGKIAVVDPHFMGTHSVS